MRRSFVGRAVAAALLCMAVIAAAPPPRAVATDLESLRARAQRIADRVSALERRLEALRARREALAADIARHTQRLALLEAAIGRAEREAAAARARYVRRAVEAYKEGASAHLALILASDDLSDLLSAAEATSNAAEDDAGALRDLVDAAAAAERVQAGVDRRKQELLRAELATEEVTEAITGALAERRAALRDLTAEIERLEEQARRRAARAAQPDVAFAELLEGSGPAAAIPDGYVGTGVTFEGIASWYGPGFAGNPTASGHVFDPSLYTAASRDLPFGTRLFVQYRGRGVVVVINDRGPYINGRFLDLSRAAAEAIGLGLGWVSAEIVVRAP